MSRLLAVLALSALVAIAWAAKCGPSSPGVPNTNPIVPGNPTFVRSVPNGALYMAGTGDDAFPIVHVWGTPYQKGYAHGQLMQQQASQFFTLAWQYLEDQVEEAINGTDPGKFSPATLQWIADVGLDVALDITYNLTAPFTGSYIYEEMKGLADGSGFSFDTLRRVHLIGELTKGDCSMFGAWGDSLADPNGLITMRALDWDMDGPFHNFAQITVYHADPSTTENSFVNIGWTGWIGSLSGVSEAQMSIHEIGVAKPDDTFGEESREGVPFTYVLRDILQWDKTQLDGVSRLASAHRTCDLILGVGGGQERRFNSVQYSASVCNIMDDKNLKPVAPWHQPIDNVVYHGMDWMCPGFNQMMHDQLAKHHGNLTAQIAIQDVMSVVQTGDLHVWVAELTKMQLWVAYARKDTASGPDNAFQRTFFHLDLNALFSTPAPSQ